MGMETYVMGCTFCMMIAWNSELSLGVLLLWTLCEADIRRDLLDLKMAHGE